MKKHYYTIGEVSNLLGIKPHVIRYWESEFSFLRPRQDEGRIRKYSLEKIELLHQIQDMLYNQRFTIEGARQKLKAQRSEAKNKARTPLPPVSSEPEPQIKEQMQELKSQLKEMVSTCERIKRKSK